MVSNSITSCNNIGDEDLNNFSLAKIIEIYKKLNENPDLGYYFIDSDGTPVNVREIRKVPYTGRIYDVDVLNDIVLVKKKGRTVWSGNSDQKMREFSRHGDIAVWGQVNATCSGSGGNTVDQLTVLSIGEDGISFGFMDLGENSSTANSINITNQGNVQIDIRVQGNADMSCALGSLGIGNISYNTSTGNYDSMSRRN